MPRPRRVYRLRRALALALVLAFLTAAAVAGRAVVIGLGGGPLTTTGSATGSSTGAPAVLQQPRRGEVYVAGPGDSLWSIVRASGVRGDPRPIVDRLQHQLGGGSLQIGEQVVVP